MEVIRNFYADDEGELVERFKGEKETVKDKVREYMGKFTREEHKLEKVWARKTGSGTADLKPENRANSDASTPKDEEPSEVSSDNRENDDEDWASEDEGPAPNANRKSTSATPVSPVRRVSGISKRRNSASKVVAGSSQARRSIQNSAHKRSASDVPSNPGHSQPRGRQVESPLNPRLNALRSREASPTRSIRFADQIEDNETPRSG